MDKEKLFFKKNRTSFHTVAAPICNAPTEPSDFWYFHASLLEPKLLHSSPTVWVNKKKPEDEWIFHFPTSVCTNVTSGSVGWTNQGNIHLYGQEHLAVMEEGAEKNSQQEAEDGGS